MTLSPKTIWIRVPLLLLLPLVLSCSPAPRFYLQHENRFTESDLEKVLAENPLHGTENIKVTTLGQGGTVSHHVVQVRDREVPHIHKEHDLTVVVLRGEGTMLLGRRRIDLSSGDVLFIPRGVVHYFVNTFSEPSVALAVFSPPFDGKDTVPVDG